MSLNDVLNQTPQAGQRGSLEEEAQAAYRWAQQQYAQQVSNDPGGHLENTDSGPQWTADSPLPKDPNSQEYKDAVNGIAIKALADRHGWNYVSDNLGRVAPLLPGLNIGNTYQQLSNLKDSDKRIADARDETFDQFMGRAVPLAVAVGGAYTGLGNGGFLGGGTGGAESLEAADAAGGLMPEYGTTAAYNSGIGAGTAGPTDATLQSILNSANVPSAANGVQVAGPTEAAAGSFNGTMPQIGYQGVPGMVDYTQAGINQVLAGSGGPGLTELGAGAAASAAGKAVVPSGDPAPAPQPSSPQNIQVGQNTNTPTGGGYTVDENGNVVGKAATTASSSIGGTKLSDVLSGNVSPTDLLSNASLGDLGRILGTGAATAGSIYADTQRADAQKEMYNQYLGLGAPSRARYEASFAPGFDVNSIPGFTNAVDTGTNAVLRKMSANGGNPFGNPGQLTEAANYITGNLALPALNNYRNQNAATGGFGAFNTAAPGVGSAAIDSGSAAYSDLGRGASDIFNPPTDLGSILRKYQATSRGGLI